MNPLTDNSETAPRPDETPDVTATVIGSTATYTARFVGTRLVELTATANDGAQVTAEAVRATPLAELRHQALKEIRRRSLMMPRDIDRELMTVAKNDGEPVMLADVVIGLAIAEQLSPDRPVEFFAEQNGVSRSTAFRWKKAAIDSGVLTPQTTEVAVGFWRQAKEREARKA